MTQRPRREDSEGETEDGEELADARDHPAAGLGRQPPGPQNPIDVSNRRSGPSLAY